MKVENNSGRSNTTNLNQSVPDFSVDSLNNASREILSTLQQSSSALEQTLNSGALNVLKKGSDAISSTEQYLNTGARNVFNNSNRYLTQLTNKLNSRADYLSSKLADFARQFQPKNNNAGIKATAILAEGGGIITDVQSASQAAGTMSKFNKFGFAALNATTGVLSTAGQFSADYDNGSSDYAQTMIRATATTAQTLASTYGISSLILAAGSGTIAAAALPATLAIGGAISVGYLADHWINSLSS